MPPLQPLARGLVAISLLFLLFQLLAVLQQPGNGSATAPVSSLDVGAPLRAEHSPLAPVLAPDVSVKPFVRVGRARFSVLTPQAVRVEWSETAEFVNDNSLVFARRSEAPPVDFTAALDPESGDLVVDTGAVRLVYRNAAQSPRFATDNLSVEFALDPAGGAGADAPRQTWRFGAPDTGNLGGTVRTLDRANGRVRLEPGLLSRDGWVFVDDRFPVFADAWERPEAPGSIPWVRPRASHALRAIDGTLFAHGRDYLAALRDYTLLAGAIPIPPKHAFGVFWSRWWPYTDEELKALYAEHEEHDVPLKNLVIDMDWHITYYEEMNAGWRDQAGQPMGWTGYTWEKSYFPDPAAFLAWCHERGLFATLNLHPASGVQPHEERYQQMAAAMGADPRAQEYVPFDIADRKYAENLMDVMLRPIERDGIDFWWLDWQSVDLTNIPHLNPTIWLNHVFFLDMERRRQAAPPFRRGLILHRWGGLGSHRYQVGFSGDVVTSWPSLAFQVQFTLTASNVAFGYWSHDVGGFMSMEETPPELFARWVQWGAISPIYRTHAWRKETLERRIWKYPEAHFVIMREAIRLRHNLFPHVYTAARTAHETGVSLIRPMYYHHPMDDRAFRGLPQFYYGSDKVIVSPVVSKAPESEQHTVWLPPGDWVVWATGETLAGDRDIVIAVPLEQIPIFVRAGAIVPLMPTVRHIDTDKADPLTIAVFGFGPAAAYTLYDDDGITTAYRDEAGFSKTELATARAEAATTVSAAGHPQPVRWIARFVAHPPPTSVTASGRPVPFRAPPALAGAERATRWAEWAVGREIDWAGVDVAEPFWWYDLQRLSVMVHLPAATRAEVTAQWPDPGKWAGVVEARQAVERVDELARAGAAWQSAPTVDMVSAALAAAHSTE